MCDSNKANNSAKNKPETPCDTSKAICPITGLPLPTCTLTSQTIATSPASRDRKNIGVGEEVKLTYSPGSATWSKIGSGDLSSTTGSTITFTAGEIGDCIVITAVGSGGSLNITFDVVTPTDLTMEKEAGTIVEHTHNQPGCGWLGVAYLHPNNVNFYRVQIREKDSQASVTGKEFRQFSGQWHGNYDPPDRVSRLISIVGHDANGSSAGEHDHIYFFGTGTLPFKDSTMSFSITWQWKVLGKSTFHDLPPVEEKIEIFADGLCRASKAGRSEECRFSDPTTP